MTTRTGDEDMADAEPICDDDHQWVRPEELHPPEPCPACPCCTLQLCQQADAEGLRCGIVADAGDFELVRECPCGQAAFERRLNQLGADPAGE